MKIIISGGGTGGHIYPAIAIADAIKELAPETEIMFVGAEGKMEMEKVPEAGYPIEGLPIAGIQRKLTLKNLSFPFKLMKSLYKAGNILNKFQPDVVVGVGGYASGPIMKAANNRAIPTLIQEQNSYAGLTNKLLAGHAKKVCVAYPNMEHYFPKERIQFTGNPVRQDISSLDEKAKKEGYEHFGLTEGKQTLLILGGSLGARTINQSIGNGIEKLVDAGIQVIWQTGKFYFEEYKQKFGGREKEGIHIMPFIKRMDLAYASADFAVSRAGALSISELCLTGLPSILVPSPNVAEDHQTKNAMALVNESAAILVKDTDADQDLINKIIDLSKDEAQRKILSEAILKLGRPNAAKDIAESVLNLAP